MVQLVAYAVVGSNFSPLPIHTATLMPLPCVLPYIQNTTRTHACDQLLHMSIYLFSAHSVTICIAERTPTCTDVKAVCSSVEARLHVYIVSM